MIYVCLSAAQYCVLFCIRSVYVGDQMRESGAHIDAMTNLNMLVSVLYVYIDQSVH